MKWLERHKYLALLLAILALILVYPVLRESIPTRVVFDALVSAVYFVAVLVIFTRKRYHVFALVLGMPAVLLIWADYLLPGLASRPLAVAAHAVAAGFLAFAVVSIVASIYYQRALTPDGICGTLCGYLLVGLAFGHVYCVLELSAPGSFRLDGESMAPAERGGQTHFLLSYFSLITLTTVGYGDVTPASAAARGFAAVQAVLGQFYMAVLLADLVGKRVAQAYAARQGEGETGHRP